MTKSSHENDTTIITSQRDPFSKLCKDGFNSSSRGTATNARPAIPNPRSVDNKTIAAIPGEKLSSQSRRIRWQSSEGRVWQCAFLQAPGVTSGQSSVNPLKRLYIRGTFFSATTYDANCVCFNELLSIVMSNYDPTY